MKSNLLYIQIKCSKPDKQIKTNSHAADKDYAKCNLMQCNLSEKQTQYSLTRNRNMRVKSSLARMGSQRELFLNEILVPPKEDAHPSLDIHSSLSLIP